ncbi:hypothetical protein O9H85_08235 [Paenibacillus filicis]|uniref:Uncharacterized protein n=1 Tax=Paenibacillus gyeongsangnamensis TaxID=3388067 RepID=A0ABT4Q6K4_9BACL|nr:hypothetical protein [Paenibacillus filicis]MCZ8512421.1 hypothetical protein [Paenibacillus filicis]
MMNKLGKADKWLIDEIANELKENFGIKKSEAEKMVKKSNFMTLLQTMPEQVHHDSPRSWANIISKQMKHKQLAY